MKFVSKKLVSLVLIGASAVATLGGCAPLVIGGAVMGSLMAVDRRTSGTQIEDEGIELRAVSRVRENLGERVHVNITSYNRQVLLTGEVPSAQDKQLVQQVVSTVPSVKVIINELEVLGNSSMTQRTSDALITGKVKAGLVDTRDLHASAFKVVTERATVYLMGRVTQREADRATSVARGTGGVQKVVRVLEIISEDEMRAMRPQPAPGEARK